MNRVKQVINKYANVVLALLLVVISFYSFYTSAYELYVSELSRGGKGYVTDEVWYVSAARNILIKIFQCEPVQYNTYGATIVFKEKPTNMYQLNKLAKEIGVSIKTSYDKINAIYINGSKDSVRSFIERASGLYEIVDVIPGWELPNNEGINNYINWEHPPLGKYFILLAIQSAGDNPLSWRLPVIIAGVVTVLLTYLIVFDLTRNKIIAFMCGLLLSIENISRAIFAVAILDGFVALFTVLAMFFVVKKKYYATLITGIVAGLFKATGLFALIPVIIIIAWMRTQRFTKPTILDFLGDLIELTMLSALLYIALLTLASIPIIYYMELNNWVRYSLIGSMEWHLSVKCTKPGCPISSAPWDWFIGHNSFILFYYPDGKALLAQGYFPIWFTSLLLALVYLPLIYRGYRRYGITLLFLIGVFLGYVGIWLLGSRTQYSFYAIQLAPLVYIHLFYVMAQFAIDSKAQLELLRTWRLVFARLIFIVERLLMLGGVESQ